MVQQTTDTPRREEQRLRMSYEEFLAWVDEDAHAEWVDGEVILFMPPQTRHQEIVGFLNMLLWLFTNLFKPGTVLVAPFEMRLAALNASREPDLLFVAQEHRVRLTAERLEGAADLVVEVVSPSSVQRDRQTKFSEYQRAGVREYWIIDPRPDMQRFEGYVLGEDGQYQAMEPDEQGRCYSVVLPGLWLLPDWLWQESLPDPLQVLQALSPEVQQAFRQSLGL